MNPTYEQSESTGTIAGEIPEGDISALREAKQIIKCLVKFIQGKKLYAKNNPLLTTFSKEIRSAFDEFFRQHDEIILMIDQYSIKWEDQVIYENSKREESIAFLLYKDGIGEISFRNSLNFEEVEKFANIIIDEMLRASPEDDVVTKLWRADFEHVSYRVLDEYLSGEFGEGDGAMASKEPSPLDSDDHQELLPMFRDKGRVTVEGNAELESLDSYFIDLVSHLGAPLEGSEREQRIEELLETFFQIGSEELKLCHEELLEEKRKDGILQLVDTMFDFIAFSSNPSVLRDVYNIVERLVEYFVQEKLSAQLKETLRRMRDFMEKPSQTEELRQFYMGLQKKLCDARTLDYLTEGIVQWNKQTEDTLNYLACLGTPAVDTMIRLLQNAESVRLRNEICDQLIGVIGKSGAERVISSIGKEKPEVAIAAIYLAGAAELQSIPASVKELIFYPDTKVREEMIKYLAFSEDAEARTLLLRMLDDEEKKIRMKALGALEGKNYPEIRQKLDALAYDKELNKKSHDEQEAIFMILGSVGDAQTVKRLEDLVVKRNKFFSRNRDSSVLAIRALERIKEPEAVRLLEKLAADSSPLVQTQARRALGALAKSMTGSE